MNKRIYYLLVLFFIEMSGISCKDKQVQPPVVYANNTLYATMNESIIANGMYVFAPRHVKYSGDTLSLYAINITDSGSACQGTIALGIYVYARHTGVYALGNFNTNYAFNSAYGFCSLNSFAYYTDSVHTGSINITLLDTIHHLVSGTFSFTPEMQQPLRNEGTETISNGHFSNVSW